MQELTRALCSEEKGESNGISEAALAADSALVISAGADTTLVVLTYLIFRMLREPHYYKELQAYLVRILGDVRSHGLTLNTDID